MKKMVSINPATGDVNREFEFYSHEKINESIKKSRDAFSDWKRMDVSERGRHLISAAKVLRRKKKDLGEIITMEMGKPIKESIPEVEKCAWALEYFGENAERFLEPQIVETDANKAYVSFEPRGTILCIMPWNFPFWQALRFAAPEIEKVFSDAGFPEGVFQTLLIDGPTASSLIKRKEIDAVSLTGSVFAGQHVAEVCAQNMKKFVLELGGSDPFIVLEDADIEQAAKIAVLSRFQDAGQSCIAAKRFIVVQSIAQEFTSKFVEITSKLKVGNPMDPDTDIGPLVRKEQIQIIEDQVQDSLSKGAKVLLSGGRLPGKGYFYSPVILTDVTKEMKVINEETFAPVAPVIPVKDEAEAISTANDSELGLGASLWTKDINNGIRLSRELEAGVVVINSLVKSDPRLPFGGIKKSGIGRKLSKFGLYEFMNIKSVSVF